MKILIIRFSAIGDIVWTSPVVRCIKKQIPGVEIHFVTKARFTDLVNSNPYIDKIHYLNGTLSQLINILRQEKYDQIIDLHNNLRSWLIKLALMRPFHTFDKLSFRRFLYTKFQLNVMPANLHVVDRMMATVDHLGVKNDGLGLDFFIASKNEIVPGSISQVLEAGFAAFVIGASQPTKKLPMHKMVELCRKIALPVILIGGPEDKNNGEQLRLALEGEKLIFNTCGNFNLAQSASVVKQAKVVFGHDTGLTHIAAAFGKKIYSIWGSTSPVGYVPYMANNIVIENKNLPCRPCSKSGRKACPLLHFKCLNELSLDEYF